MKRRLFIGSSSEGIKIARQVKGIIDAACGEWLECIIWDEGTVFVYNKSFFDSLIHASRRFDYGLLIATSDDIAFMRKSVLKVPRDNVIFEMGLFLGSLGLKRTFLLAHMESKLPSDFNGITIPKFTSLETLENDLQGVIDELFSTKHSYNLRPVPSAALALGYFESFVLPVSHSRLNENFIFKILLPETIDELGQQIEHYKVHHPSEEISVRENGARPFVYRSINNKSEYWDVPTTLKTLRKLISMLTASAEVGINNEENEWISQEIRNFKGTLEVQIAKSPSCMKKVVVEWL